MVYLREDSRVDTLGLWKLCVSEKDEVARTTREEPGDEIGLFI